MSEPRLNAYTRALVIAVGLAAVVVLALWARSEAAQGALITLLAAATGYLFRGKVQAPGGDA